jgi:hypothetical protein
VLVRACRGLLDLHCGRDERRVRPSPADGEVSDRTLCLDAVVSVCRDFELAQWILFDSGAR